MIIRFILKKLSPARIIALGFILLIFTGSVLLILPISVKEGVSLKYIDSLYVSTSAVCVTGLVTVTPSETFTVFGKLVIGTLMQIGGLGVTVIGAGIIMAVGKRIGLKGSSLVRESSNLSSSKGIINFVKSVFFTTLIIETIGAVLSFITLIRKYPFPKALGYSIFHSIASFNNSGFDLFGDSLAQFKGDVYFNIVTAILIIIGGIGFPLVREVIGKRFKWKQFSMHTKVVLTTSATLMLAGTLLLRMTERISFLGAFFSSVSARTAGFESYSIGGFSSAGILIMIVLMIIGASPGSTGGGIKTTTFFALLCGIYSAATNKSEKAFKYAMPSDAFKKAAIITFMAIGIVFTGTYLMLVFESGNAAVSFSDALFEMTSAFATVGLTKGITQGLSSASKLLTIIIMYIGRLGPMTIATLWYFNKGERISYSEGNISIG